MTTRGIRSLSAKGMALYEERVADYKKRCYASWLKVTECLDLVSSLSRDSSINDIDVVEQQLLERYEHFVELRETFEQYLKSVKSESSHAELETLVTDSLLHEKAKLQAVEKIDDTRQVILRMVMASVKAKSVISSVRSNYSNKSAHSTKSSRSDLLALKQAEAEAAKVKLYYAEQEATLLKQRAEVDANLQVLSQKKAAEAVAAEVKVLQDADSDFKSDKQSEHSDKLNLKVLPVSEPHELVGDYIKKTAEISRPSDSSIGESLCKFLLKKDLALSRLTTFSDKPEAYQAWKTSFKTVMLEMDTSPSEELDLAVKWLGPNTRQHAVSIRSSFRNNPALACEKLWTRLNERYGKPENVYQSISKRLESFPRLTYRDSNKWYELSDLLNEVLALKEDSEYSIALSFFDSSVGVSPVLAKLPVNIQERWASKANDYKKKHSASFPPFTAFVEFIGDQAILRNDPSLRSFTPPEPKDGASRSVFTRKTDIPSNPTSERQGNYAVNLCPIHKAKHSLNECYVFKKKSYSEKKQFVKERRLCFKCLKPNHRAKECSYAVSCSSCNSNSHLSVMHPDSNSTAEREKGGESLALGLGSNMNSENSPPQVTSRFTSVDTHGYKSCAKIVLVNIFVDSNPSKKLKCYAIIDEQSNRTLAKPALFNALYVDCPEEEFQVNTCTGMSVTKGRSCAKFIVSSVDDSVSYTLPCVFECPHIPCNKSEICTPDDVKYFSHLSNVASCLPPYDVDVDILLLIGRDAIDVHKVHEQIVGPPGSPFAHRIGLGWVVVGELCLGDFHAQSRVNVNKTQVLSSGRQSLFKPCDTVFSVVETCYSYDPVFVQTAIDNQPSPSVDDRIFVDIMDKNMHKDGSGKWISPLPFKSPRKRLPNNRKMALKRAQLLHASFDKNPVKKELCVEFMSKIIDKGHAEVAPPLSTVDHGGEIQECWYLPIFGVFHPKKPNQIRCVFDASAEFQGTSLNTVLLSGPDLTNSLIGILMRFRLERIPVTVDIEQMFYCFLVEEKHRDFLRFLWYKNNDPDQELIDYRMRVHVFGNSSSPAVATYGLRKSVAESDADVFDFVTNNFYVDDGLTSKSSPADVVNLVKRAQSDLANCGLRLHKIASCNVEVMKSFNAEDLAKDLKCLDFETDALPAQRSLGISWFLDMDCFSFKIETSARPITRRSILSTVNSLFDPLGFVAPVTVVGKLILRLLTNTGNGWDDPVSSEVESKFSSWKESLRELSDLQIPRAYFSTPLVKLTSLELHVFADASEAAISAVAYLVAVCPEIKECSFVMGKSKVAPRTGHTIPRLELCASVLAVEIADSVKQHLRFPISVVRFYSDSRIVLGYIHNTSKRFYTYVSNRVNRIRQSSYSNQWNYICTSANPADIGSRGCCPKQLKESQWFSGPSFLLNSKEVIPEFFPLLNPADDSEVRRQVTTLATHSSFGCKPKWSDRFSKFSSWKRLVLAISVLRFLAASRRQKVPIKSVQEAQVQYKSPKFRMQSEIFVLRRVQREVYKDEIDCLEASQSVLRSSSVLKLDPFLDSDGLLKVGGRLSRSDIPTSEKHPVLLPGFHPVSKLIASHFHEKVQHQGRHFTEGAIRSAGYWITGGKRLVSSLIFNCVTCRKLRGKFQFQKMSDLPSDRVERSTPFSHVGVDVFGPWNVVARKTRGGHACSKRWAVMFTCLAIRAVHIEVVEEMTSSAFINALRRFMAIRGKVKVFRSDRGTNFVGATDSLKVDAVNVESADTRNFLYNSDCVWLFNPPHSSHFGGSWERMIGVTRRILDAMLGTVSNLNHDVLVTFMAEISAIINARPIVPVSSDGDSPDVLSPATLLTQKVLNDEQAVGEMDIKLLYKDQWKRVKFLADQFWLRWRRDYLQTLQQRQKWNTVQDPISQGDVVLVKDKEFVRNKWPIALVARVFPSADSLVRKVEVAMFKDGKKSYFIRPIVDLVLLVKSTAST